MGPLGLRARSPALGMETGASAQTPELESTLCPTVQIHRLCQSRAEHTSQAPELPELTGLDSPGLKGRGDGQDHSADESVRVAEWV